MAEKLTAKLSDGTEWEFVDMRIFDDGRAEAALIRCKPKIVAPEYLYSTNTDYPVCTCSSDKNFWVQYIRMDLVKEQREGPVEKWLVVNKKTKGVWGACQSREKAEVSLAQMTSPSEYRIVHVREVEE